MLKKTVLLLALACAGLLPFHVSAAPAVIIVVRHAEKAAAPAEDPPLTPAGKMRAAELARVVEAWTAAGTPVRGLFASEVMRTQQTLAPITTTTHIPVTVLPAKDIDGLVKQIRAIDGGLVVVAGHSNTVPAIVQALGAKPGAKPGAPTWTIGDAEYDLIFVITPAGVLDMRYGARSEVR